MENKIIPVRRTIAGMEMFMPGSVPSMDDLPAQLCPTGFGDYLELPPRPDGEPVIQPLPMETEFDLGLDSTFEDENQDKEDDEYQGDDDDRDDAAIEEDSEDTPPTRQMILL
ncbi:hypothetical protein OH491_24810 [Termitidicoccus mucosus]|uniref:hypothetical protein n=1 Tax=Termitidicoccus mucosus TaxID=1184151 RepID=UPI0011AB6CF5